MTSMFPELASRGSYPERPAAPARTTPPIVFVVADDDYVRRSLEQLIKATGLEVEGCGSAEAFLSVPRPAVPCCLLLEVSLNGANGLELQRQVGARMDVPVVFITGRPDVRVTVQAMKAGAVDVLAEPVNPEQLLSAVDAAIDLSRAALLRDATLRSLRDEPDDGHLREKVDSVLHFGRIVGRSRALNQVLKQLDDVAATDATVLITGESGTGKELLAKEIHGRGRRSQRPFVRVNCSAIPREMFESEFFGHARGAFTGAVRDRPGRFQVADGGTIFLDEIGDLPIDRQPKLLRVLQEGEYERVGEDVTRRVDVRVIAATNQNLAEEVRERRFRQDLFYRLNVFPLELPPLRARTGDIPLLAAHAIVEVSKRHRTQAPPLTTEDAARLQQYHWPGNIRELQNVIERAVILSKGIRLRLDIALPGLPAVAATSTTDLDAQEVIVTDREWRERERTNLLKALERADGQIYGQGGAAELLGINPTTLASRLRALRVRDLAPKGC